MFWLFATEAGAAATQHAAEEAEHLPIIVEKVNHFLGGYALSFEKQFTEPIWNSIFAHFGTTAQEVFGPYTAANAIPWYTVMFVIACALSVLIVWALRGKLSADDPHNRQQTLESAVLAVRGMLVDVVGEQGVKYFPVVGTFGLLILVSNLMGFLPFFKSPTAATSVTFALGISSFVYYNYIGIKENGIGAHLAHLAGPIWWMAPVIFLLETLSNFIRPLTLGLRLFGNMYADEKIGETVSHLGGLVGIGSAWTEILVPVALMPLALFVAFVQTFVFILLSMVYLSEVSHGDHHDHGGHVEHDHDATAAVDHGAVASAAH